MQGASQKYYTVLQFICTPNKKNNNDNNRHCLDFKATSGSHKGCNKKKLWTMPQKKHTKKNMNVQKQREEIEVEEEKE